jgi:hypothetical protein
MALTQVETSGLSGSGASSNSTTGNVFSQTGPFKNRIINGDMRIDQRNAGASVGTSSGTLVYTLDRWAANYSQTSKYTVQQNAGSVTPPAGFTNYLGVTSSSAYSVLSSDYFMVNQRIEGFNVADLDWGTANAATVTLSFWVRSSLTGTFGGVITNSAQNRSYPFTYTISAANTWELERITIAGDTSGTWLTNNGVGLFVNFGFGVGSTYSGTAGAWSGSNLYSATGAASVVGTNGATFYITGVQLEAGSVATPFERRSYGQELALCQRYYEKSYTIETTPGTVTAIGFIDVTGNSQGGNVVMYPLRFAVAKRAAPSITGYTASSGASGSWDYVRSGASGTGTFTVDTIGTNGARTYTNVGAAWTAAEMQGHYTASAEL